MSSAARMCYDKVLPRELFRAHDATEPAFPGARPRAIAPRGKKWPVGSKLRVRFLGGTDQQRKLVQRFAPAWCEHANLALVFDDSPQAEIRISFDENDGSWSYVGVDCREVPTHAATMNLGWQDEAVILHEFGHAVGLAHEHQNPQGGIQWNEAVVIRDLAGPPNFWDAETVRHNVLHKYQLDQINGTEFDPESIMLYAFPGTWTVAGEGTRENSKLSKLDKQFIATTYPGVGTSRPPISLTVTEVSSRAGAISAPGEQDLFEFQVTTAGVHTIETTGDADLMMRLFGPNSRTSLVGQDDDSGIGPNPSITANLVVGTYYVQVRHFSPLQTGKYRIRVFR